MKNIFNVKLYLQALKKIKLLGIACSAITVVISMLFPIINLLEELEDKRRLGAAQFHKIYDQMNIISDGSFSPMLILLIIFTPFFFFSMFSYLNKRNESDFYHAIPFKRTTVVVSFSAAIYTWLWGTALVSLLINTLLWSLCESFSFSFLLVPKLLGIVCFATLYFGAFTLLAITLTGTPVSSSTLALILFCLFRVVTFFFTSIIDNHFSYIDLTKSYLSIFSTKYWFPVAFLRGFFSDMSVFSNAALWIWSSIVVIGFFALGIHFYRTRKSETASKSAPSKRLQHLYRLAFTLPFALLTVFMAFVEDDFSVILIFLVLTLLAYYLYELITTKSIKSMLKCTPYLLVLAAVCVVFSGAVFGSFAVFGNESTAVEDIKEVGLYERRSELFSFEDRYYTLSYEEMTTNELTISSEEARKIVSDAWTRTKEKGNGLIEEPYQTRDVLIARPSGRFIGRRLRFTTDELKRLEDLLLTSPEYNNAFLEIPSEKEFYDGSLRCYVNDAQNYTNFEINKKIWNLFVAEYNELSEQDKILFKQNALPDATHYRITGRGDHHSTAFLIDYTVPASFVKTIEALQPLYEYELNDQYTMMKDEFERCKQLDFKEGDYSISIDGYLLCNNVSGPVSVNSFFVPVSEDESTRLAVEKIIAFLKDHLATKKEFQINDCGMITLQINHYSSDYYSSVNIPISKVPYTDASLFKDICNISYEKDIEAMIFDIRQRMKDFLAKGKENCELNVHFKTYYDNNDEDPIWFDNALHYDGANQSEFETLENAFDWLDSHIVAAYDYMHGDYQTVTLVLCNYALEKEEILEIPIGTNIPREDFDDFAKRAFGEDYNIQKEE